MIYISTSCIKKDRIVDVLNEFHNHGIENVELSGGTRYYDSIADDLIKYNKLFNYVCHAYFPPPKCDFVINLASCNDHNYNQSLEFYKHTIEFLSKLSIHTLSIHAGFYIDIGTDEIGKKISNHNVYNNNESIDRFIDAYKILSDLCSNNGITLYLENNVISYENYMNWNKNDYLMLTNSYSILELYNKHNFNFLLDFGHLNVSSNTLNLDFESEVEKLSKIAKWYHLSDNDGTRDLHLPLQNNSNIINVFKKFFNKNVPVTLETKGVISDVLKSMNYVEEIYNEN